MARTADQILQDTLGAQALQLIHLMALVESLQERLASFDLPDPTPSGESTQPVQS